MCGWQHEPFLPDGEKRFVASFLMERNGCHPTPSRSDQPWLTSLSPPRAPPVALRHPNPQPSSRRESPEQKAAPRRAGAIQSGSRAGGIGRRGVARGLIRSTTAGPKRLGARSKRHAVPHRADGCMGQVLKGAERGGLPGCQCAACQGITVPAYPAINALRPFALARP